MRETHVVVAFGTRRGEGQLFCEDAIGVNGWAMHGDAAGMDEGVPGQFQQLPLSGPLLVAVADGVSGHPAAVSASLAAAEHLTRRGLASQRSMLVASANALHTRLTEAAQELGIPGTAGTTVAGAIITVQGTVICFNVGDSRVYRTYAGSLVQMSRDDVDARGGMSMWLGRPDVQGVDPFVTTVEPVRSQRILLCTDGLYRTVGAERLQELMCAESTVTPRQIIHTLLSAAEGSVDDATGIVIETATRNASDDPASMPGGTLGYSPQPAASRTTAPVPLQTPPPRVDPQAHTTERPRRRWAAWFAGSENSSAG
ncbi:MAG TPA: protein phosphatase 2C domain-containing protein [Propionibacteriaceae bacterium]|jgi:serine/threonine protein phosphatase PrpC|nr:protein phosphatase 2C domain-containing protein [Propionibacteriaceae bacterium]